MIQCADKAQGDDATMKKGEHKEHLYLNIRTAVMIYLLARRRIFILDSAAETGVHSSTED
jgi:hypothetical protein